MLDSGTLSNFRPIVSSSPSSSVVSAAVLATFIALGLPSTAVAQAESPPALQAGQLSDSIVVDGMLNETAWSGTQATDSFLQTQPREGAQPTGRTVVRVLAGPQALVIGILSEDPNPAGIVSFNVRRDAELEDEDHVRVVLGPFLDGRSGYVFAINPSGARYDGLIEPGSDDENPNWDGIWEGAAARVDTGWSAELWIPLQTLNFNPDIRQWHFNVERRIQ
jgi:hypothetical protein